MFAYMDRIREILAQVEKEEESSMNDAINVMTEAILKKKSLFAFGASHAGILTQELYYRAGGLMNMNPIFGREIMLDTEPVTFTSKMERLPEYGRMLAEKTPFASGDVLIVHSVSGRNPVAIDLALEAREKGVTIITLTNLSYSKSVTSRHPSGHNLYHYSDIVIDNHGDIGDAACEIEGLEQKVSPSSTVIGASILHSIITEVVRELVKRGMEKPPIFYSANLDNGDELNKTLIKEFEQTIHYKF